MNAELADQAQPKNGWFANHWLLRAPAYHYFYRYPLVWLLAAMIVGFSCQRFLGDDMIPLLFIAVPLLLSAAFWLHWKRHRGLAGWAAIAAASLFAATYGRVFEPPTSDALSQAARRESQPIAVRVIVDSVAVWRPNPNHRQGDPASEPWQTQWGVVCESVRHDDSWNPIHARSKLTVPGRIDDFLPGDSLEVYGNYRRISSPTNPGAFDFAERAQSNSEFVRLSADHRQQVSLIGTQNTHPLRRLRGIVVRNVDRYLRKWVTFDQAPLAAALVFGQRAQVDWEDQQELMATGTLHLLAISGMHVGILAAVIFFVCGFLSTRNQTEFYAVTIVCGLYTALAGGNPPVLRAFVLIALFSLARVWGRKTRLANFLSLAAIALLLIHSANLSNVGVHLSFLAVGSIGIFAVDRQFDTQRRSALRSVIEQSYSGWYRRWLIFLRAAKDSIQLSFWVWLMTCPLVWNNFHVIAPIAIPLNVCIAIPLVASLLAGLTTGLLGWITPLGWIAGKVTGASLEFISWMITMGRSVPFGHLWLPSPPSWWTATFYLFTIGWLLVFGRKKRRPLGWILSGWLAVGVAFYGFGERGYMAKNPAVDDSSNGELRCTFLDVGHGTSVMIEHPGGEVWLYDAGHLGAAERSHQEIAAALWELPTARLGKLIISHADTDHYNATRGLLERFNIGDIASTRRFWQSTARDVTELHDRIATSNVNRLEWNAQSAGQTGQVRWRVLHPTDSLNDDSDNASSICLLLEYAGKRILLPGDLEGNGMLDLVSLPERPCHVLMAPHHGSLSHDPSELLAWCRPEVVIISGNHRALQPLVLERYANIGARLGVTFRDGALQVRISSDGVLSSWRWEVDTWTPL